MNTNLNQLLKDLEIGPAYVKILICLLGCTFMLYPTFFHFTCFFREYSKFVAFQYEMFRFPSFLRYLELLANI